MTSESCTSDSSDHAVDAQASDLGFFFFWGVNVGSLGGIGGFVVGVEMGGKIGSGVCRWDWGFYILIYMLLYG